MKGLNIPAKEKSPKVTFDPERRLFEMEGNSRPENVRDFYYPIIDMLRKYFEQIVSLLKSSSVNLQGSKEAGYCSCGCTV